MVRDALRAGDALTMGFWQNKNGQGIITGGDGVGAGVAGGGACQRGDSVRLTPREGELLSLLSGGYRNKELASMLGIKEQTVKMHLYRLFQKLHVESRMAAVLAAGARREPLGK